MDYFCLLGKPECTNYNVLSEGTRSVNTKFNYLKERIWYCDSMDEASLTQGDRAHNKRSPGWIGSAWYRFTGPGGTKIPEKAPGMYSCNNVLIHDNFTLTLH